MSDLTDADSRSGREALLDIAALDSLRGLPAIDDGGQGDDAARFGASYLEARLSFEPAAAMLALSVPEAEPPPSLHSRLMATVSGKARKPVVAEGSLAVKAGVTAVRTTDARWRRSPMPLTEYKLVAYDAERRATTSLVRFAPGMRYPAHRHGGTEEIFVLEGSMSLNGVTLKAGDYCRSVAGTEEVGTFTLEGALALVVTSDFDEMMNPATA